VRADRLRIKQVLLNLLSNAVKYNRHGGEVRIACDFAAPGRVRLTVSDTGLGIPEDQQDGLFTAFHRLGREDSDIEGTGIGLAISKKLVELMGGDIGVESRIGQGSTFWVDLPDADVGAEPACAPAEVMQEAPCATPAAPDCAPADPSVRR
jgi:signal transduction histidine kinase